MIERQSNEIFNSASMTWLTLFNHTHRSKMIGSGTLDEG
jgi:hypothetical protein